MVKMSDERDALRAAIGEAEGAKITLANTVAARDRAVAIEHAAIEEVERFASLDADIAAHHGNALKEAIVVAAPVPDLRSLPVELVEAKAQRETAREKVAAIKGVVQELTQDCRRAGMHVDRCAYQVELAIEKIIVAEADERARDFLDRLSDLRRAYWHLSGMVVRQVRIDPDDPRPPGSYAATRPINFSPAVGEVIRQQIVGDAEIREGSAVRQSAMHAVDAYVVRLRADSDARLE
jgi:hypothetical protein